jgi:hypothetical protein
MITREYLISKGYTDAEIEAIGRELYADLCREEGLDPTATEEWIPFDMDDYIGQEFDDVPF